MPQREGCPDRNRSSSHGAPPWARSQALPPRHFGYPFRLPRLRERETRRRVSPLRCCAQAPPQIRVGGSRRSCRARPQPAAVRDTYGVTSEGTGTARHTLWWGQIGPWRPLTRVHAGAQRACGGHGYALRCVWSRCRRRSASRPMPWPSPLRGGHCGDEEEPASGRFVLLHDLRARALGRRLASRDLRPGRAQPEVASDPMLGAVGCRGWSTPSRATVCPTPPRPAP